MAYQEYNEINNLTCEFTYNEFFCICKKLESESSKLKNIFFVYKSTISFLEKN